MSSKIIQRRASVSGQSRSTRLVAAAGLALSLSSRVLAQTDAHWTNAVSGAWNDPSRWSTNPAYPNNGGGNTYRAFIDAVGANYVITSSGNVVLDYLRINSANATLRLTAGIFTAPTLDLMAGTLDLEGGTIANSTINMMGGSITSSSTSIFDAVTFNGTFAANFNGHVRHGLTANGEMTIGGSLSLDGSQTLTGSFAISNTAASDFVFGRETGTNLNPTITLAAGSTIHGSSGSGFRTCSIADGSGVSGTFINLGTVSADSLNQSIVFSTHQFTNNGLIQAINGGSLYVNNLTGNVNSASVDGASSQMYLAGTYTLNSPVSVTNGGFLDLSGAWTNTAGITASGANTLVNLHGSLNAGNIGPISATNGARIGMAGDYDNTGQTLAFSSANPGWSLTGGSITGGTVSTSGGESLHAGWGSLHGINNTGAMIVGNGAGGTVTLDGNWSNSGAITFTGTSTTLVLGGNFSTSGIGSIASTGGSVNVTGTVNNAGQTLTLDASRANWSFFNATVNGGTISVAGGGVFQNLGSGSTTTLNGVTLAGTINFPSGHLATSSLVNQAALTMNGGSLVLDGAWSNPGTINAANNTQVTLKGTFAAADLAHLTTSAGALTISGVFDNTGHAMSNAQWGNWTLDGGSITGGTITGVGTGDRFHILDHQDSLLSGVAVDGSFTAAEANSSTHTTLSLHNGTTVVGPVTMQLSALDIDATSSVNGALSLGNGCVCTIHGANRTISNAVVVGLHSAPIPDSVIRLDPGANLTIAPAGLIHGNGGTIGEPASPGAPTTITNQGRIAMDLGSGSMTVNAGSFINTGTVESTGGGTLTVNNILGNLNTVRVTGTNSQLVLGGFYTINTPVTVTSGTLTLNGAWVNAAGITATNATINLGGSFTSAGVGTISRSGTTAVNISGMLDNTGATLTLSSVDNLIGLNGGTINGGTVATSGGQRLLQRGGASSLLGVTVNGDTTISAGTLTAGATTTFNGEVAFTQGVLQFQSGTTVGSGTFNFTSSSAGSEIRTVPAPSPTFLTLGSAVVVHGGTGAVGEAGPGGGPTSIANQGLISADATGRTMTVSPDAFTNTGILEAINGGLLVVNNLQGGTGTARALGAGSQLTLGGTYTIDSPLSVDGATLSLNGAWTNTAGVVANNATVNLGGSFTTSGIGSFTRTGTTSLNITGQLNNSGSTLLVDSPSDNFGLAGGTITGGTISTANGQRFTQVSGNSTLAGVSVPGDVTIASGSLTATGSTVFTGEVAIGAGIFQVPSGSTIPSGAFRFTGSPTGVMRAAPSGSAATLTLGPGATVHGGGTGAGATLGTQTPDNTTINNYGTISADVPGQVLTVNAFLNNFGTIQAVNGGELDTTYIQQAGHALASGPGSVLVLYGAPYTITAPLSVSDGARLVLASNWTNSSTINIDHATLDLGGNFGPSGFNGIVNDGGNVRITGTLDARGLPLTIPAGLNLSVPYQLWSGTLTIPASETVNVSGTLAQSILTGGGNIVLANGNITGPQGSPATLNIGSGITITGYGSVSGSSTTGFPFTNAGTIRADVTGQTMAVGSNGFVNSGTLEAVNGGLLTIGGSPWSNTGLIRSGDGCSITLNGSYTFGGGTIDAEGTGNIIVRGTLNNTGATLTATGNILLDGPTITGGTVNVPTGALQFAVPNSNSGVRFTGVTLNGEVEVTGASSSFGRLIYLQSGLSGASGFHVTGGASTITCENTETIAGADFFFDSSAAGNRRIIGAPNQTYTLAPTTTIHGGGVTLFDPTAGGTNEALVNQGLISADVAGQTIAVIPSTLTNQGTLEAVNGATLRVGDIGQGTMPWTNTGTLHVGAGGVLQLGGIFTLGSIPIQNTGGSVQLFGRINNAGQTLTLTGGNNSMSLANGWGTIAGGNVVVSNNGLTVPAGGGGTLDGAALSGDVTSNSVLTLLHGASFTDTIHIGDGGRLDIGSYPYAQYVLSTGTIEFDGTTTYPVLGADNLVIGPNVVVHGGNGQFGRTLGNAGTWTWVNQGRISADVPGKTIVINGIDNFGTLEALNGGTMSVGGTFEAGTVLRAINSTFELTGGPGSLISSMERVNATVNLGGTIDNSGNTITMDAGTTWGLKSGLKLKGGTVNVASGADVIFGVGAPTLGGITLENLAFNGDLVTTPNLLEVDIRTLALGGTLSLRTPSSKAVFVGDQSFNSGTIFFDASGGSGERQITPLGLGPNGAGFSVITFGPAATIHGGDGVIRLGWGAGALGTFINQGLVSADINGTQIAIEQQRFVNSGTVQAINGGTIQYEGPPALDGGDPWVLFNSGTLFAGAGSTLVLDSVESAPGSLFSFQISGPESFGQLFANAADLDGRLVVQFGPGFVPSAGEGFQIMEIGAVSGQFAEVDLPSLPAGLSWNTTALYSSGTLGVVPGPAALCVLGMAGVVLGTRRRRS